ncbi:MAG: bifunctional class I SAM-dependent methyltransferase/glycosyltransferase family 2 protein [Planctomycetota bacterium]|nr:bifunctional class I SAM-dependent methyltransferase/glycosyltransferase family 2 protein [Planctomycetota bacterium]
MSQTQTAPAETADPRIVHHDARVAHWNALAARPGSGAYHRRLESVYRFLVPQGRRVIELGCAQGDLLASLAPSQGVGVDFAPAMLDAARQRHPDANLRWHAGDIHDLALDETFDVVILSDLVNDLWDVQAALERAHRLCHPRTRLILNFYSRVWQLPLGIARRVGLARPLLEQNWLTPTDVENLLYLTGFETVRRWTDMVWPVSTPLIDGLCNRWLARLWPMDHLGVTNFILARPRPEPATGAGTGGAETKGRIANPRVSVIIPARNESGNVPAILSRTPEMAGGTELVFVEGHSTDDTWAEIQRRVAENPGRAIQTMQQTGKGKGDAVRLGFARATGDILVILDADLTVPPEDLPRFVDALAQGRGEFINGVRLVYPMERRAMRFLNLIANKFFSLAFSWVLGQPIKDTLCGTKVIWRRDYELLAANRAYFGEFDPFGDFDLIFGAAKLNLKIVDIPIRYRERTYGTTNIHRWRHGMLLLRMLAFAARRLKFR